MKLCLATSGVLSLLLRLPCLLLLPRPRTAVVAAITKEECKTQYLPELLACLDAGRDDCAPLPLLDEALPNNPVNELGYWIQNLRDTPETQVFAVGDDGYNHMLVIDIPSYNKNLDAATAACPSSCHRERRSGPWRLKNPTGRNASSGP